MRCEFEQKVCLRPFLSQKYGGSCYSGDVKFNGISGSKLNGGKLSMFLIVHRKKSDRVCCLNTRLGNSRATLSFILFTFAQSQTLRPYSFLTCLSSALPGLPFRSTFQPSIPATLSSV